MAILNLQLSVLETSLFTLSGSLTFIFILGGIELIVEADAEALPVGIVLELIVRAVAIYDEVIRTRSEDIVRHQRYTQ